MTPFKLPASGEDLSFAVREYVEKTYDEVRNELEWRYLPQALMAIWAFSPELAQARKTLPQPITEIADICHIIVTFPGSTAVDRIRDLLIHAQIVPNAEGQYENAQKMASELFTLTMRYTRVQNLARHIRTAVNSHLKVLGIETNRERSRSSSLYETSLTKIIPSFLDKVNELRSARLTSELAVNSWADDVNNLLSLTSSGGILNSERLDRAGRTRTSVTSGAINSYKLRFKQAIASTLEIDLATKEVRIEKTSNKSLEGLLRELEELPKDFAPLYQMLENLRPKRISRPYALRNEFVYESKSVSGDSSKKNLLKHVLSLTGRELIIEGSRGAFTADMISGVLKTVGLQLSIDPDARELRAAFESSGQVLRVQIEKPKKSDLKKLSEILQQLI
jgi:hypothetical protein